MRDKSKDPLIPLVVGRPNDGSRNYNMDNNNDLHGASFSRFVLPFSYKLEVCEAPSQSETSDNLCYELNQKENLSFTKRRKYFTQETSVTLYDRSIWLDMSDGWKDSAWGKSEITINLRDNDYQIGMLPPRIILFEVERDLKELSQRSKAESILQTGFLCVDLFFPEQEPKPELDDLLQLNEYFRYFGMPHDFHSTIFSRIFSNIPTKYQEANKTIGDVYKEDKGNLKCYFERWANLLEIPVKENDRCYRLFPEEWGKNAKAFAYNEKQDKETGNWQIYADNRCYVWTTAFLEEGGETLRKEFEPEKISLKAKDYGHWLKLLNVDNPEYDSEKKRYKPSIDNHRSPSDFEQEWVDKRTYKRWEHTGSWYGYSYHSGACLSKLDDNMIFHPWSSYYFDTSLLLFYIRLSLFRFSHQLTEIFKSERHDDKWRESLQKLRKDFSKFTVLYQFPLLSNQQQSLEMYELNRKCFDIEDFFKEIQSEIDNTHNFMESIHGNKLANSANNLARFGIPIAAGGLIAGLFGMNPFNLATCFNNPECTTNWDIWVEFTSVIIATIATWFVMGLFKGDK